jgi:hypothetical protein
MRLSFASLALAIRCSWALSVPSSSLSAESALQLRQASPCENTPTSRHCWGNHNIDTNFYEETPNTGVVRGKCLVQLDSHGLAYTDIWLT